MATALLDDLAQRINQHESQLQALRRELETRRQQLTNLTQRKEDLLSKLRQLDEEIGKLAGGSMPSKFASAGPQDTKPKANVAKAAVRQVLISPKASSAAVGKAQSGGKQSLSSLLLTILNDAGRSMTVAELAKEAKRLGFRSKSKNFAKTVESRAYDLQKRRLIRHPEGRPGFELSTSVKQPPVTHAKQSLANGGRNGSAASKSVNPSFAKFGGNRLPLRQVVTDILGSSRTPMTADELTKRVLASGYRSKSKDFKEVMWVTLGKLKSVENVKGRGWRLKY